MSLKKSTAKLIQNTNDSIKGMEKSLFEESKKISQKLISQDVTKDLPFDLPINFTTEELVDEKISNVINPSTGTNESTPNEGTVGDTLYVYNGDNDDFGDKSLLGKNRWIIVWGGINYATKEWMKEQFAQSDFYRTKNWAFTNYNMKGGRKKVLKDIRSLGKE